MPRTPLILAGLLGAGIIVIGLRFLISPETAATNFGVPATGSGEASAYLATKGVRDIASGLFGLLLLARGLYRTLGGFLLLAALIPIVDTVIVLNHGGSLPVALGIHGATAAALLGLGGWLLSQARDQPRHHAGGIG
ncbi:DUF4267 domain-containing protein [Natronosporangium hydrolyticum]|uniref:DUF4267 domain-containing protein n=1 Tax=Natronosporangium hydrolyticum TaxID=2811111 RepID=A0A895Y9Y8_9ACTN|nr:DUF4267 domain-containing protein [Natronosporangium hydrolyticum]QSB14557.1 DUF4267 domain-containing protein [Natronosporangium hydrolyticum]